MRCKFIASTHTTLKIVRSRLHDDDSQKNVLRLGVFVTRKTNQIKHADMVRDLGIHPNYGGIVKYIGDKEKKPFYYGQSDECDFKTPLSLTDQLNKNLSISDWYKTLIIAKDIEHLKNPYWVFRLISYDEDYSLLPVPVSEGGHLEWEPTTMEEMIALMEDEDHQENGTIYP